MRMSEGNAEGGVSLPELPIVRHAMATDLTNRETRDVTPQDAEEQAFLERLRANGARVGDVWDLDRPRVIGKQRPWWLAVVFRTLRRLELYDD